MKKDFLQRVLYLDIETGGIGREYPVLSYYLSQGPSDVSKMAKQEHFIKPPIGSYVSQWSVEHIFPQMKGIDITPIREFYKPFYATGDLAHSISHADDVYNLAMQMSAGRFDPKLVALAAYTHDMYSGQNRKLHNKLAYEYVMGAKDKFIQELTGKERKLVAHAVLEHRASYKGGFYSQLSEIISSADIGPPNLEKIARRSFAYHKGNIAAVYDHLIDRYGPGGYVKYPKTYEAFFSKELKEFREQIKNLTPQSLEELLSRPPAVEQKTKGFAKFGRKLVSEKEALNTITGVLKLHKGGVLAGWNIEGFDIPHLITRKKKYGAYGRMEEAFGGMRVWDVAESYKKLMARGFEDVGPLSKYGGKYRDFIASWVGYRRGKRSPWGWSLGMQHEFWGKELERRGVLPKGWYGERAKLIESLGGAHRAGVDIEIMTKDLAELMLTKRRQMLETIREDPAAFRQRLYEAFYKSRTPREGQRAVKVTKELLQKEGIVGGENRVIEAIKGKFAGLREFRPSKKFWIGAGAVVGAAALLGFTFSGFDDAYNTIEGFQESGEAARNRKDYDFGSGWRRQGTVPPMYLMNQKIDPRIRAYRQEVWDVTERRKQVEEYIREEQEKAQAGLGEFSSSDYRTYPARLITAINEKNKALRVIRLNQFEINVDDADTILLKRKDRSWWAKLKDFFGVGEAISIRLAGIDAPEVASHKSDPLSLIRIWEEQPGGKEATELFKQMLKMRREDLLLVVDPTRKTYGRYLGVVGTTYGENINLELLRAGAVTALPFGKEEWDILNRRSAARAEAEAYRDRRGIWQYKRYQAIRTANQAIGRPITHNVLTRLDKLARNLNLGAYTSYLASLGAEKGELTEYEARKARRFGRSLRKTHGPPPPKRKQAYNKFSGFDDAYNTIEGLQERGVAGQRRKQTTEFGSGWRGRHIVGAGAAVLGAAAVAGWLFDDSLERRRREAEEEKSSFLGKLAKGIGVTALLTGASLVFPAAVSGGAVLVMGKKVGLPGVGKLAGSVSKAMLKNQWEMIKGAFRVYKRMHFSKEGAEALKQLVGELPEAESTFGKRLWYGLKYLGGKGEAAVEHTAHWLNTHWLPELKKFEPGAVALAGLSVYEGYEAIKDTYHGDYWGATKSLLSFAASKYAYMGWFHRAKVMDFVRKQKMWDWVHYINAAGVAFGQARTAAVEGTLYASAYLRTGARYNQYFDVYSKIAAEEGVKFGFNIKDIFSNLAKDVEPEHLDFLKEVFAYDEWVKVGRKVKDFWNKKSGDDIYEGLSSFFSGMGEESWVGGKVEEKLKEEKWKERVKKAWDKAHEKVDPFVEKYGRKAKQKVKEKGAKDAAKEAWEKLKNDERVKKAKEAAKNAKSSSEVKESIKQAKEKVKEKMHDVAGDIYFDLGEIAKERGVKDPFAGMSREEVIEKFQDIGFVKDFVEKANITDKDIRDALRNRKDDVLDALKGIQFSGFDDAFNSIPGFQEGGLAAFLRKVGTDFGSGFDPVKQIARQMGMSFEDLIKNKDFILAIKQAVRRGRVLDSWEGGFGVTELREAIYRGNYFNFVVKAAKRDVQGATEAMISEAENLRKLEGLDYFPSLYHEIEGKGIMMEYMPGSPIAERDLTTSEVIETMKAAKAAMDRGVFNYDIHRGNFLFSERGVSWIDWGLGYRGEAHDVPFRTRYGVRRPKMESRAVIYESLARMRTEPNPTFLDALGRHGMPDEVFRMSMEEHGPWGGISVNRLEWNLTHNVPPVSREARMVQNAARSFRMAAAQRQTQEQIFESANGSSRTRPGGRRHLR